MSRPLLFHVLADAVLLLHFAFVAFVVVGLGLIVGGGFRGWKWIRNPSFRLAHLAAIGLVVAQAWLGVICPLTLIEQNFRERAGEETYQGTFIAHWVHQLLFYEGPPWVFMIAYTLFGVAVVASWICFRPQSLSKQNRKK
jgi:hypothetical protein